MEIKFKELVLPVAGNVVAVLRSDWAMFEAALAVD